MDETKTSTVCALVNAGGWQDHRNFIIQAILVLSAVSDALGRVRAVHLAVAAAVLDALDRKSVV